jgi:hypothetical protein
MARAKSSLILISSSSGSVIKSLHLFKLEKVRILLFFISLNIPNNGSNSYPLFPARVLTSLKVNGRILLISSSSSGKSQSSSNNSPVLTSSSKCLKPFTSSVAIASWEFKVNSLT